MITGKRLLGWSERDSDTSLQAKNKKAQPVIIDVKFNSQQNLLSSL